MSSSQKEAESALLRPLQVNRTVIIRLPYDVRRMIYAELFTASIIHIMSVTEATRQKLEELNFPGPKDRGRWTHCTCDGYHELFSLEKSNWYPRRTHKWQTVQLSFIYTCKQIYEEMIPLLYRQATFSFNSVSDLLHFKRGYADPFPLQSLNIFVTVTEQAFFTDDHALIDALVGLMMDTQHLSRFHINAEGPIDLFFGVMLVCAEYFENVTLSRKGFTSIGPKSAAKYYESITS